MSLSSVFQRDIIEESVKDSTSLIEEKIIKVEGKKVEMVKNYAAKNHEKKYISKHMAVNSLVTGEKNFGDASSVTIKDEENIASFGNQCSNSNGKIIFIKIDCF